MTLTQAKINSVDVTSYLLGYVNERVYGDSIGECDLTFIKTITSAVTLNNGQTVEIWRIS